MLFSKLFFNVIGLIDYNNFTKIYNKTTNINNEMIFNENVKFINDMNSKNLTYTLDINEYTDIQFDFMSDMNIRENCHNCFIGKTENKKSVDWRKENAVTYVKNQGDCGSCWSFSATGAIEGAVAVRFNKLYNISEQQLIDCSRIQGNKGCQGGSMDNAFKYVIDNQGICSEEDYPYEGKMDFCKENQCGHVVRIRDYSDVETNNELALMKAVQNNPVSVAIQANLLSFQFYKKGIYQDENCGTKLDHGVLVVGYGKDDFTNLDYWIVKNSWGPNWGEDGYVRMLRNDDSSRSGMCGIAMQPSFPIV